MSTYIAINGMGVVGRDILRQCILRENFGFEPVLINDPHISAENLVYLLKNDSIYHNTSLEISVSKINENVIVINGKNITFTHETDVAEIPIGGTVDLALECTGRITNQEGLYRFITAGAQRVIACYPNSDTITVAYGVNHGQITSDKQVIAMANIGVQVAANIANALSGDIEEGFINQFAPYINGQQLMDSENESNFALGRAAAWNISPFRSQAAKYLGQVIPELNGKVIGMDYRSPTIDGGVCNMVLACSKSVTVDELNDKIATYVYSDVLGTTDEPLVSSDALGHDAFLLLTKYTSVLQSEKNIVSLTAIYDSVRGQALQTLRTAQYMVTPQS